MINLENKNIIVTGATGGIGNSIIKTLNDSKANILATGTKIDKLEELKSKYNRVKILQFDISKKENIEKFIDDATNQLDGNLDCIINNAGVTRDNLAIRMSIEEWNKVLEEIEELKEEIKNGNQDRIESEYGDLLFALINYM